MTASRRVELRNGLGSITVSGDLVFLELGQREQKLISEIVDAIWRYEREMVDEPIEAAS